MGAQLRSHPATNPIRTTCTQFRRPEGSPTRAKVAVPPSGGFWCDGLSSGQWWIERFGQCTVRALDYTVWDKDGNIVGTAVFAVRDEIELDAKSLLFFEFVEVELIEQRNAAHNIEVSWTSDCSLCTNPVTGEQPDSESPWSGFHPIAPREKIDGSLGWEDNAVQCQDPEGDCQLVDAGSIEINVDARQPDAIQGSPPGDWTSYQIRCDMVVQAYTGCVVPDAAPTFEVRSDTYGASVAMISWAQTNLGDHWGLEGQGPPLHRLPDGSSGDTNRTIICDSTFAPIEPPVETDSCDEYPFAATSESGALNGVTSGAQCAQVAAVQGGDANAPLQLRWPNVQPIGTFTGSERCVRGHIPLLLNTGVGGALGRFTQENHVLGGEAYWVDAA